MVDCEEKLTLNLFIIIVGIPESVDGSAIISHSLYAPNLAT